jgi:hypothetical protein
MLCTKENKVRSVSLIHQASDAFFFFGWVSVTEIRKLIVYIQDTATSLALRTYTLSSHVFVNLKKINKSLSLEAVQNLTSQKGVCNL